MTPRDFVSVGLPLIGSPYVWRGKGLYVWDAIKGLIPNPWGENVFDCVGLVTHMLWRAGGPDYRASMNADSFWLSPMLTQVSPASLGDFRFYGRPCTRTEAKKRGSELPLATHIAVSLGGELVLEAAGAGDDCTSPKDARRLGAGVRVAFDKRSDLLGTRRLPFNQFQGSHT